jgi:hypothetical protein
LNIPVPDKVKVQRILDKIHPSYRKYTYGQTYANIQDLAETAIKIQEAVIKETSYRPPPGHVVVPKTLHFYQADKQIIIIKQTPRRLAHVTHPWSITKFTMSDNYRSPHEKYSSERESINIRDSWQRRIKRPDRPYDKPITNKQADSADPTAENTRRVHFNITC